MGRVFAPQTVSGRSVWILTMMQSCASAAKLRAAGPFSPSAFGATSATGSRHLGSSTGSPTPSVLIVGMCRRRGRRDLGRPRPDLQRGRDRSAKGGRCAVQELKVRGTKFPGNRQKYRDFHRRSLRIRLVARNPEPNSVIYDPIPYASEQGSYFSLAGN